MKTVESVRADLPNLVTALPGPKARAIIERDDAVVSPSYTRSYPLVVARGKGAMIEDVDGNRFLDCTAGIAVVSTGHCHPKVVEAIQQQAERLIHMSGTDFYYQNFVELAEKLSMLAPGDMPRRVAFGNSGTEAIEAALKLARYHTGRGQFIAFFGAFHGRTMGSLALTGSKSTQKKGFFPVMQGVHHIPYANCYRCAYGKTPDSCAVECVKVIEDQLFRQTLPPEEVAAIFVEPVQGEGGYIVPPKKFFDELKRVAEKNDILIVADEVQSGMGRTGKMFASEHFDLVPDVMALAKGIASGMPLGATVARADLMDWPPGRACVHVWGQSSVHFRGSGNDRAAGEGAGRKCRDCGRAHEGPARGFFAALSPRRRCARPGIDDRNRIRARPGDQRAGSGSARSHRANVFRAGPACARRGT